MNEATKAFFRKQLQQCPENQTCIDYGTEDPQWASISHGCYVSLEASGVHRSLGVHVSFVRSTTMDSWKPNQLKLMELGGNAKLKAFFQEHGIPDNTPIQDKYNTRAAEWYRRNLRALADGLEQPAPLPAGTGALPLNEPTTSAPATGSFPEGSVRNASFVRGYHADPGGSAASPAEAPQGANKNFLGFLDKSVGQQVSGKLWGAVGAVESWAGKAKAAVGDTVAQAQKEGFLESALGSVQQASSATRSFVSDGGGKQILGKTTDAIGETARSSMTLVNSGVGWVSQQLETLAHNGGNSAALQGMSSGQMQGFGSDSVSVPKIAPEAAGASQSATESRPPYHEDMGPDLASQSTRPEAPVRPQHEPPQALKNLWEDDNWDEWK